MCRFDLTLTFAFTLTLTLSYRERNAILAQGLMISVMWNFIVLISFNCIRLCFNANFV